jgi:pimeloyl-ACP methyl ester carboxylesterase
MESASEPVDKREVEDSTTQELGGLSAALPPEVTRALASKGPIAANLLNRLFTIEHQVSVGNGRKIHVTETFSLRAWLRFPHRGLLMLPGPLTKGDFYQIDVDGYRGRDIIASRGFFAFTADFEGTGLSTFPADGRSPVQDREIQAMKSVILQLEAIRLIPRMDVLGESWGGGVAAELCADRARVKSCTLASMLYRTPSDFANMTFRSPAFRAFLDTLPDGYLPTTPDIYFPIVGNSPPAVQAWTLANQPGLYTTVPLYDVFDLPFFDPTVARVPGRVIQGELDPNQSLDDARDLANDYDSRPAELVVINGATHIPRVEALPLANQFWNAVTEFIDP